MTPDALAGAAAAHFVADYGDGTNDDLMFTRVRVAVLRALGCTCHNPAGEPCWHKEDLMCPVHPSRITR
jgi:hypothetical protein